MKKKGRIPDGIRPFLWLGLILDFNYDQKYY